MEELDWNSEYSMNKGNITPGMKQIRLAIDQTPSDGHVSKENTPALDFA
jgi:hypothetical protein